MKAVGICMVLAWTFSKVHGKQKGHRAISDKVEKIITLFRVKKDGGKSEAAVLLTCASGA